MPRSLLQEFQIRQRFRQTRFRDVARRQRRVVSALTDRVFANEILVSAKIGFGKFQRGAAFVRLRARFLELLLARAVLRLFERRARLI